MKMNSGTAGRLEAEEVRDLFRRRGVKLTHQRLEIIREVVGADDHPSAEDIHRRIRPRLPTVSLDTVYRTLETLEQLGLIARVEILDDRTRYEPDREPHHHLVCASCRKVVDFSWPELDRLAAPPAAKGWGKIAGRHMELRGICRECQTGGKRQG